MDKLASAIIVIGSVEQAEILDEEQMKKIAASRVATMVANDPKVSEDGAVLS